MGESGYVRMIAPLPICEIIEFPIMFFAITFAKMLEPQVK
jgi:hypothetical protein